MKRSVISICLLLTALASSGAAVERILFIGNSLTYVNDVPGIVQRLAIESGKRVVCEMVAFPDFSLADHLEDGRARRAIQSGTWDWIVLQQGPSALPASREEMSDSSRKLAGLARKQTRFLIFGVWPSADRATDIGRINDTCAIVAAQIGGACAAAGVTWQRAGRTDPRLRLYGPDGFHPSPAGSYAAALTIYRQIFGELPERFSRVDVAERALRQPVNAGHSELLTLLDAARAP